MLQIKKNMLRGRVLLLNQSFEVLGTIGVARAVRMTLREDNPVMIHETVPERFLTSGNGTKFPIPSVISLKHYVKVPESRRDTSNKREKIYLRDNYTCQYCSVQLGKKHPATGLIMKKSDLTLDHIKPKSKGGSSHPTNLVTACKPCNQRKADRTPDQAHMPLKTVIHDVTSMVGSDKLMLCKYIEDRPEWLPYVEHQEGYAEALQYLKKANE